MSRNPFDLFLFPISLLLEDVVLSHYSDDERPGT